MNIGTDRKNSKWIKQKKANINSKWEQHINCVNKIVCKWKDLEIVSSYEYLGFISKDAKYDTEVPNQQKK